MTAYYNEHDAGAAEWLRQLIAGGHIAHGDVDTRSIEDVTPDDLRGYTQCHFFAGIGGWSLALRLAGWPDDRPVWTGSCPCQPFSAAGKGAGFADERHLWPAFHRLIEQCRPPVVFGEQVASKDGLGWFDLVSADLEGSGYTIGAADLCAAGVGAPHIRQRLWFVAHDLRPAASGLQHAPGDGRRERWAEPSRGSLASGRSADGLVHGLVAGLEGLARDGRNGDEPGWLGADATGSVASTSRVGGLADAEHPERGAIGFTGEDGHYGADNRRAQAHGEPGTCGEVRRALPSNGAWRDADWLFCRDGKWRSVESGTFPLAHGIPGRVGLLRGYGNAIVPQVAATFIEAFNEVRGDI